MENIDILISEEDIENRIKEIADELSIRYKDKDTVAVGILNGAVYFLSELTKRMTIPVEVDFMQVSSYGDGTVSSGHVVVKKDLERDIAGKHVILIEDIVDTGRTLKLIEEMLEVRKAKSIAVCVLLDKPDRREVELKADHVCFEIPDEFVVGWGMDVGQKYRNLPYIGIVRS